jgi:hypothetical protein
MKFYLGTHIPAWVNKYPYPFFISCRTVLNRKSEMIGDWIMDSAGFTELMKYGTYNISQEEYLECINITNPWFAFCQDWMCEDIILKKTGKTILEHQELTCRNYVDLKKKCNKIQPVLQGWSSDDYINHIKMYKNFNVDTNQIFGVGTICKRNTNVQIIYEILSKIKDFSPEIKLHGFGLKITSLKEKQIQSLLMSADSMAWSYAGRYTHLNCADCNVKNCANCYKYAKMWYDDLLTRM